MFKSWVFSNILLREKQIKTNKKENRQTSRGAHPSGVCFAYPWLPLFLVITVIRRLVALFNVKRSNLTSNLFLTSLKNENMGRLCVVLSVSAGAWTGNWSRQVALFAHTKTTKPTKHTYTFELGSYISPLKPQNENQAWLPALSK